MHSSDCNGQQEKKKVRYVFQTVLCHANVLHTPLPPFGALALKLLHHGFITFQLVLKDRNYRFTVLSTSIFLLLAPIVHASIRPVLQRCFPHLLAEWSHHARSLVVKTVAVFMTVFYPGTNVCVCVCMYVPDVVVVFACVCVCLCMDACVCSLAFSPGWVWVCPCRLSIG
jgi:hypothetical protein